MRAHPSNSCKGLSGTIEMKKLFLIAALAAALSACSDTQDTAASHSEGDRPSILQALESQGLRIHSPMAVPGGLNAFAASSGTQPLAVYIMPDENYALVGTLLDSQGNPVAQEELQKLVSEPMDEATWEALEAARWIQDGDPNAERIVYTFTDANCPFCNELWNSARPWVEAGKVQLRHLMVGVIRVDSPAKAAAILEADDPQAALTHNELNHDKGGIEPLENISAQTTAALNGNLELMRELGFSGTPGVVAKKDDGALIFQSGVPRGPALEQLFGPL